MNNTDDQTAGLILSPAVFVYVRLKMYGVFAFFDNVCNNKK